MLWVRRFIRLLLIGCALPCQLNRVSCYVGWKPLRQRFKQSLKQSIHGVHCQTCMTKWKKCTIEQCDVIYRGQRRGDLLNRSLIAHQKADKRVYLGLQHREKGAGRCSGNRARWGRDGKGMGWWGGGGQAPVRLSSVRLSSAVTCHCRLAFLVNLSTSTDDLSTKGQCVPFLTAVNLTWA